MKSLLLILFAMTAYGQTVPAPKIPPGWGEEPKADACAVWHADGKKYNGDCVSQPAAKREKLSVEALPIPKATTLDERRNMICKPLDMDGRWNCSVEDGVIDAPPIYENYLVEQIFTCIDTCPTPRTSLTPVDGWNKYTRPTCADKTRFLMTAEDGSKHCIKLEASDGQSARWN